MALSGACPEDKKGACVAAFGLDDEATGAREASRFASCGGPSLLSAGALEVDGDGGTAGLLAKHPMGQREWLKTKARQGLKDDDFMFARTEDETDRPRGRNAQLAGPCPPTTATSYVVPSAAMGASDSECSNLPAGGHYLG